MSIENGQEDYHNPTPPDLVDERYGSGEVWPAPESIGDEPDPEQGETEPVVAAGPVDTEVLSDDAIKKLEVMREAAASLRFARRTLEIADTLAEQDTAKLRVRQAEREYLVASDELEDARKPQAGLEP